MMLSNMAENVTQDYKIWKTAHKIVLVIRWRYVGSYDFLDGTTIQSALTVGMVSVVIALFALKRIKESFGSDLNWIES